MNQRRIYDDEQHAHYVTFSCYKKRRLPDHDRAKRIVLGVLDSQLAARSARCVGRALKPKKAVAQKTRDTSIVSLRCVKLGKGGWM